MPVRLHTDTHTHTHTQKVKKNPFNMNTGRARIVGSGARKKESIDVSHERIKDKHKC